MSDAPKTIRIPLSDIDALNKYRVVDGIDRPTVGDPCVRYVLDKPRVGTCKICHEPIKTKDDGTIHYPSKGGFYWHGRCYEVQVKMDEYYLKWSECVERLRTAAPTETMKED